ncbi:MAG: hypothetical protein RMM07_07300, partial [Anaerolineae bacterium]|nr:hypothetical protein [Anaerolineae bacterium]
MIQRYRSAVEKDWAYLKDWSALSDSGAPLDLERVFFRLMARPRPERRPVEPPEPELDADPKRLEAAGHPAVDREVLPPVPLGQILRETRHAVLLGEPGAGKSTTLRFIGLCFARVEQNWHRERLGVEEPLVPVLLRLADLHADLGKQPPLRQNIIDEVASRLQCNEQIAEQLVDGWMEESLLLVLLDGLDEVPEA